MGRQTYCVTNGEIRKLFEELVDETELDEEELELNPEDWVLKKFYERQDNAVEKPKISGNSWKKLTCKATERVRFQCSNKGCNAVWTSFETSLVFYFKKQKDEKGLVLIKFHRQQCKNRHAFVRGLWPEVAMETALIKLIDRILFYYYNGPDPRKPPATSGRKGDPRHLRELCEGCQLGDCQEFKLNQAMAALKI